MDNWIPFVEGEYRVEQTFLVAANHSAVIVEDVIVEIYSGQRGQRFLRGRGRIRNILMVELLEESDDLDLLLDFGEEFKYRLKGPNLQAGKVFSQIVSLSYSPRCEIILHCFKRSWPGNGWGQSA